MEKKLYRGALIFFMVMLLISILWPYEQKFKDWDLDPDYAVRESDEIFFNNTRIHLYSTEERKELAQQGFKAHRYLRCSKDTNNPFLNFTIINSWRTDQAYILAEPSEKDLFSDTVQITVHDSVVDFQLGHMDFEDHYTMAAWIFQNSLANQDAYLLIDGDSLNLFGTQGNQNANYVVLKDYFRLIGRYQ